MPTALPGGRSREEGRPAAPPGGHSKEADWDGAGVSEEGEGRRPALGWE